MKKEEISSPLTLRRGRIRVCAECQDQVEEGDVYYLIHVDDFYHPICEACFKKKAGRAHGRRQP